VLANIAAAGVDPAVLLTHMHPDPSAGLSDPATGRRYFSNAELVVHENEPAHWFDDDAMAKASERQRRLYFMCAREQITPYKDRTRLVQKGEVFPGVIAVPCHGHTPGHTSFLISSRNEQLLIWGDTVHVPEIQTARREVCMEFDTDLVVVAPARVRHGGDRPAGDHRHAPALSRIRSSRAPRLFKKQVEECRELERQAPVAAEDRAFWRQAADRWQEQLRQAQTQTQTRKKAAGKRADRSGFKYTAEA
jgi:glyoxylase-like metal-dependent hydrolase (beta-lactamase superfamily II)